jgi:hypothetical protein
LFFSFLFLFLFLFFFSNLLFPTAAKAHYSPFGLVGWFNRFTTVDARRSSCISTVSAILPARHAYTLRVSATVGFRISAGFAMTTRLAFARTSSRSLSLCLMAPQISADNQLNPSRFSGHRVPDRPCNWSTSFSHPLDPYHTILTPPATGERSLIPCATAKFTLFPMSSHLAYVFSLAHGCRFPLSLSTKKKLRRSPLHYDCRKK